MQAGGWPCLGTIYHFNLTNNWVCIGEFTFQLYSKNWGRGEHKGKELGAEPQKNREGGGGRNLL